MTIQEIAICDGHTMPHRIPCDRIGPHSCTVCAVHLCEAHAYEWRYQFYKRNADGAIIASGLDGTEVAPAPTRLCASCCRLIGSSGFRNDAEVQEAVAAIFDAFAVLVRGYDAKRALTQQQTPPPSPGSVGRGNPNIPPKPPGTP
jgi:hypothetical protein